MARRPASARPSVTSSAYSRSPPTGRPLASRVTRRLAEAVGEIRSRRLAGHRRIRREDDLRDAVLFDARKQPVDSKVAGLDAVERRQRPAEDVVEAAVLARALDRDDVHRLLDDADDGAVTTCVRADAQSSSSVRLPHSRQNRTRAFTSSIARDSSSASSGRVVKDVKREPLCRAPTDARELRQLRDEVLDGRAEHDESLAVRFRTPPRVRFDL